MVISRVMAQGDSRGFSLIELLVALSIVAILAALLFPTFASARRNAHMTECASNLHQIGIALKVYSGDWDGRYPPNNVNMLKVRKQLVWELLTPYTQNSQIFHCPDELSAWDKDLGYEYRTFLNGSPIDPLELAPAPGSGTVVAMCDQHLVRSGMGWLLIHIRVSWGQ